MIQGRVSTGYSKEIVSLIFRILHAELAHEAELASNEFSEYKGERI